MNTWLWIGDTDAIVSSSEIPQKVSSIPHTYGSHSQLLRLTLDDRTYVFPIISHGQTTHRASPQENAYARSGYLQTLLNRYAGGYRVVPYGTIAFLAAPTKVPSLSPQTGSPSRQPTPRPSESPITHKERVANNGGTYVAGDVTGSNLGGTHTSTTTTTTTTNNNGNSNSFGNVNTGGGSLNTGAISNSSLNTKVHNGNVVTGSKDGSDDSNEISASEISGIVISSLSLIGGAIAWVFRGKISYHIRTCCCVIKGEVGPEGEGEEDGASNRPSSVQIAETKTNMGENETKEASTSNNRRSRSASLPPSRTNRASSVSSIVGMMTRRQ